ncbi:MAG: PAS domain S-box protein, partial [bacterium]|nr:PAS domain S-box protein [bacterium]
MHRLGVVVRLILVMAMVSIAVAGVAIHLLYRTTLIEERTRLVVAAQSQARLLEAINRWEQADAARYPDHDHSSENALAIIVNAHDNYRGFSQTGEFTLARREGQNMVFLLRHRHSDLSQPAPVRFDAELAEPMRRALSGLSGVVVGLDYRGIQVLAAHEPVADLDWGIVAKIDVAEVRAPFVRAGLITGGIGLVIVLAGATLFVRIGAPLVRRLAESGERLQMALSAADVGTWRWDPLADRDTRDASFNRILGLETAESTRPVEDFFGRIHHEDRSAVEDALRVAVERRSPYATEFRIVRPGGETRWLRDQGKGHYSQNGEMIYMTGAVVDITERKRAEETLASTTSFLDTVVDMSPFAMWVSDRAGTVIRTNHALRKTLNLTNEHIAGKYNVLEDTNLQIQGVMPMVKAVFEKHEPARFSILWTAAEAGDVTFEGGHDLHIDVSMFPILNAEGELTNVVCQWVDITERKWAEEALQESKERLIAAQRIARMGDFTWDTGTGAVTWSDAMFDLLQYDQSEKLDFERVNADIHHPDDLERVTQWLNECVATGADQLTPNEYRLIRRDGGIIDVRTVGVIHHREGNSPLVFGTVYDITERKRAEEELRGERDRAQNYLDVAGVMFVAIDEHQRVTLINRKGCEILGLSEGEIIGANWFETFLPERDKQTVKDVFAQLIAGEVAPAEYFENPVVTKDGQERLIAWHNTMLRNAAGRIVGTLGSGEDITERKRAEEALRESEERLRQIAETIEDVFWITDWESHRTLFASRAYERIWDRSLRDLYADAQNWADAIHPEDGERAWESFVQLGEGGSYDEEYRIVRPDGSMRWIRDRGFPILDSSGQICRVAGIAQDVTEHKQAEEARRLERARMMSILDAIPDGVYIVSQQWDIEYVNPVIEREFGPVDGRKCYEYFH